MSNAATFKGELLTGVPYECKELTGKEQRLLTEQGDKKAGEGFLDMMESLLVSVGSVINPDKDFIRKLLTADRKKILFDARQFTLRDSEYENKFKFTYKYHSVVKKVTQEHSLDLDVSKGCPSTPYYKFDPATGKLMLDGKEEKIVVKCKEYDEIQREVQTILPRSKKKVIFNLLDGNGEDIGAATKKKERSSHTQILMRNPRELYQKDNGGAVTPIQLHLDSLPLLDIEHLRKLIKSVEGELDTIVEFEHPEAEHKSGSEKTVRVDLVAQNAFFFPSEAI